MVEYYNKGVKQPSTTTQIHRRMDALRRPLGGKRYLYCHWEHTGEMSETRSDRLQLRVTPLQREVIESAAASQHETITDYVVRHAVSAAKDDLADRRYFSIDSAAWAEFNAHLERPPAYKPRLEKLLAQPAPWRD
jgi:uncharacterized protein (DUF1778 family)